MLRFLKNLLSLGALLTRQRIGRRKSTRTLVQLQEQQYKDTTFYLPDTEETYHVDDDGIHFLRGHSGGWTICGNSDKPGVEE